MSDPTISENDAGALIREHGIKDMEPDYHHLVFYLGDNSRLTLNIGDEEGTRDWEHEVPVAAGAGS